MNNSLGEHPIESTYSVVYLLSSHKSSWLVQGKGWSQIQLLRDPSDSTFRIVGWSVPDNGVVLNVNVTPQCKYKIKSADFHKFYDENNNTYGFGFYQRNDAIAESQSFAKAVMNAIKGQRKLTTDAANSPMRFSESVEHVVLPSTNLSNIKPINQENKKSDDESIRMKIKRGTVLERIASLQNKSNNSSIIETPPVPPARRKNNQNVPPPVPPTRMGSNSYNDHNDYNNDYDNNNNNQLQTPIISDYYYQEANDDLVEESVYEPDPEVHNTDTQVAYDIYVNGQIPLGKLHILPPKVARSMSSSISDPNEVRHVVNVRYDPETRTYHGLPPDWEKYMKVQFGVKPSSLEAMEVDGYPQKIPNILVRMRNFLVYRNAFNAEGLFRIAPDASMCNNVKQQLNDHTFETTNDVHVIANLIKVWFRELPVHILDNVPRVMMSRCDSDQDIENIMNKIDENLRCIFEWLLDLCCEVSMNSAVNKMHAKNLGIVIGPNLFAAEDITTVNPMAAMEFSQSVAKFLTKAILHRARTVWGIDLGDTQKATYKY